MQVKHETELEEAKKIKELGYDFSFCADKIYDPELKDMHLKSPLDGRWTNSGWESSYTVTAFLGEKSIPIIPYPILEACLPGHVMRYHNWNYCIKAYLNYPETQIMGMDYEFNFDQLVEAFIYCVRNYPEETKAKFEEIKKEYK